MATTVHEPPKSETRRFPKPTSGHSGNGGWAPVDGTLRTVEDYSPPPSSSAIWVGVAAICMSFAAFTSALIVRQGASTDWRHISFPPILFFSTLLLLASSVTLEVARRRVAAFMGGQESHV